MPDGLAAALGHVVADLRREWRRDLALAVAEKDALLADLRRENAELRHALAETANAQIERINAALANIKDGDPGPAGPPGESGPQGEKGDAGDAGHDGEAGPPGPAGPPGESGPQGIHGRDGRDGMQGIPGERGLDGSNGKDGIDGKDGRDGLGFDDLTIEHDGERTLTLRFARGEELREFPVVLPVPLDRGVWREGPYKRGDVVTFGGSAFIAQRDTEGQPEASKDWRLAVKRGRDGKDGKNGERGPQGKEGRPGRDLTQVSLDGSKW